MNYKTMTAQELMIGDWVNYRGICNRVAPADFCHFEWIDEIRPIPLTPEILENNFEKKTMYGIFDDYFDLDIREFNDGMYIFNYHCCEMPMPDTQIVGICYVHELQHALHFLGIDKEFQL